MTKQEVEEVQAHVKRHQWTTEKNTMALIADRERLVEALMPFALMWITPSPNVGVSHHVTDREPHRTAFNLLHELKEVL